MDETHQQEWNDATLGVIQKQGFAIDSLERRAEACECRRSDAHMALHEIAATLASATAIIKEFAPPDSARWETAMRLLCSAGAIALEGGKRKAG